MEKAIELVLRKKTIFIIGGEIYSLGLLLQKKLN
jgi:hypothetical protein